MKQGIYSYIKNSQTVFSSSASYMQKYNDILQKTKLNAMHTTKHKEIEMTL